MFSETFKNSQHCKRLYNRLIDCKSSRWMSTEPHWFFSSQIYKYFIALQTCVYWNVLLQLRLVKYVNSSTCHLSNKFSLNLITEIFMEINECEPFALVSATVLLFPSEILKFSAPCEENRGNVDSKQLIHEQKWIMCASPETLHRYRHTRRRKLNLFYPQSESEHIQQRFALGWRGDGKDRIHQRKSNKTLQ